VVFETVLLAGDVRLHPPAPQLALSARRSVFKLQDDHASSVMLCWRGRTLLLSRLSHPIRVRQVALRGVAFMSTVTTPPAPAFKPFNLALIQLGQIGADKRANLNHARDMIRRAASGEGVGGAQGKPDLIVLPVSTEHSHRYICPHQTEQFPEDCLFLSLYRNASTRLMGMCTSQSTLSLSSLNRERNIMSRLARAKA
jgi:hypothetical protein